MAAFEEDPQKTRPTFAGLRTLRDRLQLEMGPAHALSDLSMGMTNDFEIARRGGRDPGSAGHRPLRGPRRSMIAIIDHPEGCVLPVRAQPGARRPGVQERTSRCLWKLAVSQRSPRWPGQRSSGRGTSRSARSAAITGISAERRNESRQAFSHPRRHARRTRATRGRARERVTIVATQRISIAKIAGGKAATSARAAR